MVIIVSWGPSGGTATASRRVIGAERPVQRYLRVVRGAPENVPAARAFTSALLPDHPRRDDVILATSELVTNATRHTRSGDAGGTVVVELITYVGGVRLAVIDQGSGQEPHFVPLTDEEPARNGGLGLVTIDAVACRWGWYHLGQGRVVWAEFTA
ncbi:MAG: ATP-binding protein [Streptosporangiales bacterium]|nr:ATP-binding protein [Streptosporangiales bacterium]